MEYVVYLWLAVVVGVLFYSFVFDHGDD